MRIVLGEDSVLLREGIARLLEDAGFEVVAQAGDADDLLRKVRAHKPDVAIVDIRMPPTHTDAYRRIPTHTDAYRRGTTGRVDDSPRTAKHCGALLDAEPDFEVIAQAGDVDGARRHVRGHHPDVLVLDLNMPGEPALDAIPGLRADEPATQIVVLTMRDDLGFVEEARRAGALGYVLKDAAGSELVHAIRLAAAGESYLNRHMASRLVVARTLGRNWD